MDPCIMRNFNQDINCIIFFVVLLSMFLEADLEFIQSPLEECKPDIFQQWAHSEKNLKKNLHFASNERYPIDEFLCIEREMKDSGLFIQEIDQQQPQEALGLVEEMHEQLAFEKNGTQSFDLFSNDPVDFESKPKKKRELKQTQDQEFLFQADGAGTIEYLEFSNLGKQDQGVKETKKDEKALKLKKKISKFVLKDDQFKGSDKISLPKKLGKLFVNYIDKFMSEEDSSVSEFNQSIKNYLKKNVKNDYTFEKTVLRFLGQYNAEGKAVDPSLTDKVSRLYRSSMAQIIRDTMKEEVIMKQKIERNRQLYMLQLKVYYLRCRSHRLAQKGSFK